MRSVKRLTALVGALLLASPAGAWAQGAPRTDPEIGSPSESVYGIPLEEARRDGAPGAVLESTIRSENGVGSSSIVPGTARDRPDGARGPKLQRVDTEAASNQLSGDPSPFATVLLLVLVVVLAAGGGAVAGRRPA